MCSIVAKAIASIQPHWKPIEQFRQLCQQHGNVTTAKWNEPEPKPESKPEPEHER